MSGFLSGAPWAEIAHLHLDSWPYRLLRGGLASWPASQPAGQDQPSSLAEAARIRGAEPRQRVRRRQMTRDCCCCRPTCSTIHRIASAHVLCRAVSHHVMCTSLRCIIVSTGVVWYGTLLYRFAIVSYQLYQLYPAQSCALLCCLVLSCATLFCPDLSCPGSYIASVYPNVMFCPCYTMCVCVSRR